MHLGVGSHLSEGGNLQSLSLGYDASGGVTLLVNVERNHVPTRLRSFSATRGGTLTSLSGELRYTVPVGGECRRSSWPVLVPVSHVRTSTITLRTR